MDWPARGSRGKPIAQVRKIRDDVRGRVAELLRARRVGAGLSVGPATGQDLETITRLLVATGLPTATHAAAARSDPDLTAPTWLAPCGLGRRQQPPRAICPSGQIVPAEPARSTVHFAVLARTSRGKRRRT